MPTTLFSGATPLLLFIAKTTLVLVAGLVATVTLRRSTAGARHLVWLAALVGVLALPVLSTIPALQIGILPAAMGAPPSAKPGDAPAAAEMVALPRATPIATTIATTISAAPAIAPVARTPVPSADGSTPIAASPIAASPIAASPIAASPIAASPIAASPIANSASILQTIAILWAAVALGFVAWLVAGAIQVRRIVANATELTSPDWAMPLCEVADRLDLEQPPRLVLSDRIEMAFACRATAPTIVLPAAAASWSDDRRRAVLFHELSHVKRHDLLSHTLGRIACALYWFHPLVWTAAKHLRAESEKACDDLVLSCGARPSEYAQHLLDMVTSVRNHGAPVMALPMARRKEFEGRMLAILDPAIRRASPGRLQAATVAATLGALSLTVAAVAPAAARPSLPTIAQAETVRTIRATTPAPSDAPFAIATAPATPTPAPAPAPQAQMQIQTQTQTERQTQMQVSGDAGRLGKEIGRFAGVAASEALRGIGATLGNALRAQGTDTGRVGLLIRVLNTDTDAGVRRAAAWAMNDIHTPGTRAALIHALASDSDNEVREMAAWSLADYESDDAASALANALMSDKNAHVRRSAAWAIGQSSRAHSSDVLVSAISDSDAEVKQLAIWALGQIDLKRAPTALLNALSDNSPRVREMTAWTLGQIEDTAAVRPLARAFETETDNKVKTIYLWSLTQIGTAPTSVIEAAMKSSDPELRRHAVGLLAGNGGSWPWPWPWPWPRPNP